MKALVTRRQGEMSNTTSHQRGRYKKGRGRGRGDKKALDALEEDARGKWRTLQAFNKEYTTRNESKNSTLRNRRDTRRR